KLAAVGRATASALEKAGLDVDLVPTTGSSGAALAAEFPSGPGTVLLPGAEQTAGTLEPRLEEKEWRIFSLPIYSTQLVASIEPTIALLWQAKTYAAFIATSGSTVRSAARLGPTIPIVAIGISSSNEARRAGFEVVIQAKSPAPHDIVAAIQELLEEG
ncbi:MAG: uroporphyrinogen-III synthase, partial [Propionibacteriaceae bacterium]|nr:uroporphyrinogen-III synthase [Propionibacteriaceae bacterium]